MLSSYLMGWYVEGQVLYARFPETVHYEMIESAMRQIAQHALAGSAPIHVIIDASGVRQVPVNLIKIRQATEILLGSSLGWTITVSTNPLVRFLATVVMQIANGIRYQMCASLDEAQAVLSRQDPTIRWEAADESLLNGQP